MYTDPYTTPGSGAVLSSTEAEFLWNNGGHYIQDSGMIDSTAVDSGNTPTTKLRRGLLMGKITSTGLWADYDPTATDGTQKCLGILREAVNMVIPTGSSASNHMGRFVLGGPVVASQLINLDFVARKQMANRFLFDDDLIGQGLFPKELIAKAADYTVLGTVVDNNCVFTTLGGAGAINFTLPTVAKGLRFGFFNQVDQNMTITAAAGDIMVVFNDLAADSIAFSTASEKIGAYVEVFSDTAGTKWLTKVNLGAETQTPTIAT